MNISDLHRRISVTGLFDEDYLSIISYAESQGYLVPSKSQQLLQSNLLKSLKNSGIWNKLDIFYLFANDGDSDFATLNWKNPTLYKASINFSINYIINQGFQGVNGYLQINFPFLNGVNYTLNNASKYIYQFVPMTTGTLTSVNNANAELTRLDTTIQIHQINVGTNLTPIIRPNVANIKGLYSLHRINSSDIIAYMNKSSSVGEHNSSQLNWSFYRLLGRSESILTSNATISMFSLGSSLVSENNEYVDIVQNYLDSI